MNQRLRACFTLGLILTGGLTKLCQGATTDSLELNEEHLRITVHLFNSARIPRYELIGAEREATDILGRAGVKVLWVDCAISLKETPPQRACAGLYDSTNLFLDIQPPSMVKRLRLNETLLGACTASTDDRRHTQALVSYGRVDFL